MTGCAVRKRAASFARNQNCDAIMRIMARAQKKPGTKAGLFERIFSVDY
jgi:hypothetical protein